MPPHRIPDFLAARAAPKTPPARAVFPDLAAPERAAGTGTDAEPPGPVPAPAPPARPAAAPVASAPAVDANDAADAPPAPGDAGIAPAVAAERLAGAVELLRSTSSRLAEQARADALEIGVRVARRILERELATGPEPLLALVRSALRRAGDSRTVTVRLHPADAAVVRRAGREALGAVHVAKVALCADPDLARGDCVVEADFGVVDGRVSSRLAELRRVLETPDDGAAQAAEGDAA